MELNDKSPSPPRPSCHFPSCDEEQPSSLAPRGVRTAERQIRLPQQHHIAGPSTSPPEHTSHTVQVTHEASSPIPDRVTFTLPNRPKRMPFDRYRQKRLPPVADTSSSLDPYRFTHQKMGLTAEEFNRRVALKSTICLRKLKPPGGRPFWIPSPSKERSLKMTTCAWSMELHRPSLAPISGTTCGPRTSADVASTSTSTLLRMTSQF